MTSRSRRHNGEIIKANATVTESIGEEVSVSIISNLYRETQ
jgi:hypothetical protein